MAKADDIAFTAFVLDILIMSGIGLLLSVHFQVSQAGKQSYASQSPSI